MCSINREKIYLFHFTEALAARFNMTVAAILKIFLLIVIKLPAFI